MKHVLTAREMRECDRFAIESLGIPGVVLMENAGKAAALKAMELLRSAGGGRAAVYCGGGNNGGDGFVVGRWLHSFGVSVLFVLSKDTSALQGDAAINAAIAERLRIPMLLAVSQDEGAQDDAWIPAEEILVDEEARRPWGESADPREAFGPGDLVVDALLGTGLDREVRGLPSLLIDETRKLRERGCSVLALDVPSGVCSDTGRIMGGCVQADATVTFGYSKRGLALHPGARFAGALEVADIGLPREVETTFAAPPCRLLEEHSVAERLPSSPPDAHKGTFGHVLVVAGSKDRPGAAELVCRGALRGGAGLVTLATRPGGDVALRARRPEAMGIVLPGDGALGLGDLDSLLAAAEGKTAIAFGPGIPRGPETGELIDSLARETGLPLVLDADGVNAVAGGPFDLSSWPSKAVLTPHPKEMARLLRSDVESVQADRVEVASGFARKQGLYIVLKGASTVIASPEGGIALCGRGGPELATGGTGDVLTGIIAALIAQGIDTETACDAAVLSHAVAGELASERLGRAGTLASDVADELATVWKEWGY